MKKRLIAALVLPLFLFLAACDGSTYPLSDPAESTIHDDLIGTWHFAYDDEESLITIIPFNDSEYLLIGWPPGDEDEASPMGLFTTEINSTLFAVTRCIRCGDDDQNEYFFYKYALNPPDEITLFGIQDDVYDQLIELESIEAVSRYVSENMSDAGFFEDDSFTLKKRPEIEWPW
jgi:hypothetical protein